MVVDGGCIELVIGAGGTGSGVGNGAKIIGNWWW